MKRSVVGSIGLIGLVLFAHAASAAELPVEPAVKAVPYFPPETYVPWSGLYVGIHGGARSTSWHFTEIDEATTPPTLLENNRFTSRGGILGLQMGGNLAIHQRFLIGVEGDVSAQMLNDSLLSIQTPPAANGLPSPGPGQVAHNFKSPWFATGRVRAGGIFASCLLYVTAGSVLSDASVKRTQLTGSTNLAFTPPPVAETSTGTNAWGWTAGAGVEWAFTNELSAKLEYLHLWIGPSRDTTFNFALAETSLRSRLDVDVLRIGLNWKFLGSDF